MDTDWREDLKLWLEPFLSGLGHKTRRRMCPAYIAGLIGPGNCKSVQPMAARGGEAGYDQLHHFVAAGMWDSAPLEAALLSEAETLVGDPKDFLVIDDTAMPKKERHSVGVAPRYASSLGKNANCQTMVSVMLAPQGAGNGGPAVVPAGELDQRSRAHGARQGAYRPTSRHDQAGDRAS